MGKYSKASPEVQELVDQVASEIGMAQYGLDFQALNVNKAKEVVKVVKANEFTEIVSEREDLIFVICYEDAFDKVEEKDRYAWVRSAMDCVSFDSEKEKISLSCPTITVPQGYYHKVGKVAVDEAELGLLTIQQLEDEAKQRKAERAAQKKGKKKSDY